MNFKQGKCYIAFCSTRESRFRTREIIVIYSFPFLTCNTLLNEVSIHQRAYFHTCNTLSSKVSIHQCIKYCFPLPGSSGDASGENWKYGFTQREFCLRLGAVWVSVQRKYLPVVIFWSEMSGYCRYLIHAQPNLLASRFTFDVKISWRAIVVKWSRGRGLRSLLVSSTTIYLHQTNTAMFWAAEFAKEAPAILQEKFGCG